MITLSMLWAVGVAEAGPAQRMERQQARKEARQIELLQRSSSRPGVREEAAARYLDRFGHLDTRPVRRIAAWPEAQPSLVVEPAPPRMAPPSPAQGPLAIPVD